MKTIVEPVPIPSGRFGVLGVQPITLGLCAYIYLSFCVCVSMCVMRIYYENYNADCVVQINDLYRFFGDDLLPFTSITIPIYYIYWSSRMCDCRFVATDNVVHRNI